MKTIGLTIFKMSLWLLFFIALLTPTIAQTESLLLEERHYLWDAENQEWVIDLKKENRYDEKARLVNTTEYLRQDGLFDYYQTIEQTYVDDKLTQVLYSRYSEDGWKDYKRFDYEYYLNGRLWYYEKHLFIDKKWNPSSKVEYDYGTYSETHITYRPDMYKIGNWKPTGKDSTIYDLNYGKTEKVIFLWDNAFFEFSERQKYDYNKNRLLKESTIEEYDVDNELWILKNKYYYEYNEHNDLANIHYWKTLNNKLVNNFKWHYYYEYDDNDSIIYKEDWAVQIQEENHDSTLTTKYYYTFSDNYCTKNKEVFVIAYNRIWERITEIQHFDNNHNETEYIKQKWDTLQKEYINELKIERDYSPTGIETSQQKITFKAYPNPASNHITIENENFLPFATIELLDITGKKAATLHTGPLSAGRNTFHFDVPAGYYSLVISHSGRQFLQKIIVNNY